MRKTITKFSALHLVHNLTLRVLIMKEIYFEWYYFHYLINIYVCTEAIPSGGHSKRGITWS